MYFDYASVLLQFPLSIITKQMSLIYYGRAVVTNYLIVYYFQFVSKENKKWYIDILLKAEDNYIYSIIINITNIKIVLKTHK